MGFLAPWFLLGLAGLAGPLYLHLLRRRTTDPKPFSSLMFFEPRTQASMRHRRLRYLWLLALRLAVLALLVLAFANPYILRPAAKAAGSGLTVLVLDRSFSMQAQSGASGSRWDAARRAALATLASVHGPAQVMALGSRLDVLTPATTDRTLLRATIAAIPPGDSRADFGELARGLRALAAAPPTTSPAAGLPITVHLFSDLQQTSMPASFAELTLPANVTLLPHAAGSPHDLPNWTVESVKAPAALWGSPRDNPPARIEAVIAGFNTPAASRTVSLLVNGKRLASQTVSVPASGRTPVVFQTADIPYGWSRCTVELDSADALAADNHYDFAIRRAEPRQILFVHVANDFRSPLYFGAALGSGSASAFSLDSVSAAAAATMAASLGRYALVVLSNVPSMSAAFNRALTRYVQSGGGLLIAVGVDARTLPVFGGDSASAITGGRNFAQNDLVVGSSDAAYPPTALLGNWPGVRFFYAANIVPAGARVIARLSDNTPLLMEKRVGAGRVLVFASGFDNLTNDFPLHPGFVPFVREAAAYLAGDAADGPRQVDSYLTLRTANEQGVAVQVTDPSGRQPFSLDQAASLRTLRLTQAGFYQVQLADGRRQVVAVNPDRRESDLALIPADDLALWRGVPNHPSMPSAAGVAPAAPRQVPVSLWWYVTLFLLAAAVMESLVAARYLTVRRNEDSESKIPAQEVSQ